MGEHPNGFDQNGRGTLNPPEMDIPVLKNKEKEKKGAGVILPGGVPGAGALAAGANAGQAAGFMALFAGKAGLAALALGVVGAGAIGVGLMGGGSGEKKASSPRLDGLESNISVDRRNAVGSKSLSYMAKAGSGQLKWEDPNAPKPQAGAEPKSDAPADTADGEGVDEAGAEGGEGEGEGGADKPRLSGGLSGAKLSSSLGGSGAFGKNNIFSKGSGFNIKSSDLKAKSGIQGGASRLAAASKGNLSGKLRGKNSLLAGGRSTSRIKGNGALGQLKFAGTRSQAASKAGDTGAASTFAADAFDQQKTTGGQLETGAGGIGDGLGTVDPSGGTAPDVTGGDTGCPEGWAAAEGGGCTAPDITNGVDQTKYQGLLDGVLQMQKAAQQMMMIGIALIAIGVILVASEFGAAFGWGLIAAGAGMLLMAQMMNKQADQMADQIGSMYNQKKQADVLKARGEGDSSTPELEERRLEEQKKAAEGPGYEEDLTTTVPEAQPE
jgi:hypothetical protein